MNQSLLFRLRHAMPLVASFFFLICLARPPEVGHCATDGVESVFSTFEPEGNIDALLDDLADLKKQKLYLNESSSEDLLQLPWLTFSDVSTIISTRTDTGPIANQAALAEIIGEEKAAWTLPYIYFSRDLQLRRKALRDQIEGSLYTRYFTEMPERAGIATGAYAGENYKLYNRLQLTIPHLKASVVQEKDVVEPDLDDFTSFSLNAYDFGVLKSAVIGNYTLNFGEGLLMGQNRYFSKGSDPAGSVRLKSRRLKPYSSSGEYGFLQGAAFSLRPGPFEVTVFTSSNRVDGRVDGDGLITSFDESGYHRTETELERRDGVTETVEGANILWNFGASGVRGRVGGSMIHYGYSAPLETLVESGIERGDASSADLVGLEAVVTSGNAGIFVETVFSQKPDDSSWIAGASYEPTRGVSTVVAVRQYGEHYYSPFAGAFAERGDGASNEEGYYAGIDARLSRKVRVGAYYDWFRFPLLSPSSYPYPSEGHDMRLFASWKASSSIAWSLQLQHKKKEEASSAEGALGGAGTVNGYAPLPSLTDRVRLDSDIKLSRVLSIRTRGEVKRVTQKFFSGDVSYNGWLVYEQLNYKSGRLSLKWRGTVFNTDDYDSQLYAYEDGLPMQFDLGTYNGRGKSMFFLASWKAAENLKIAARYEVTYYTDREVYSSGSDLRLTDSPASFHVGCLWSF
ncbi:helix-hairpin-helix domain-containing protein [Chlorobium phaeovibrioides]|uniref:Helix-hairpin-helix domain-containing protein n=1 Tax=Chlorobium phaeovibrioides TaxID=1094 RepID=A0A432AVR4_CHLPH|nr:helix-hairpin-helix domain-containing protein [Chlorobium phaeovibrioides]RTY39122.1 helix-hairpin-helix domain-containing protein [Chlorobium phaeovibrioides]